MISFNRYINIVSGVGAGATAKQRELILRVITQNTTLPPGIIAEFQNESAVGSYFGMNSDEYKRAVMYFGFVSKSIKSPKKISFARWVSSAIAPTIVGDATTKSLNDWKSVTAGTLDLLVAGVDTTISAINTSTAATLTEVASILQTAIRAGGTGVPQLANAVVQYNTNTEQFTLMGSVTGTGSITAKAGGSSDVSVLLGWTTSGTVNVSGQAADTPAQAVSKSAAISTNFGSFVFQPTLPTTQAADVQAIAAVAAWNHAQNVKYKFLVPVVPADATALYAAVKGYSGCGLEAKSPTLAFDYCDQMPAEILASTDYTAANGAQGYMYYQFGNRNITVSDDTSADTLDAVRVNYNGATESGGQQLAFFQRGVLTGDSTSPVDMNVYANEMWFKDYIGTQLMTLLLSLPILPADTEGRAKLMGILNSCADTAKTNGTISKGKDLDTVAKQYISQITGNQDAWRQVQSSGYYCDVWFTSETTTDGRVEKVANYVMVYGKEDQIRKIDGSNVLI